MKVFIYVAAAVCFVAWLVVDFVKQRKSKKDGDVHAEVKNESNSDNDK